MPGAKRHDPIALPTRFRLRSNRLALAGAVILVWWWRSAWPGRCCNQTDQVHTHSTPPGCPRASRGIRSAPTISATTCWAGSWVAGRTSLAIGVLAGLLATAIGAIWGALAGYAAAGWTRC
ncbi:hypothetical protein [Kutzneria kofuensis]|uniref:hypothetical protein n=1 Tax=Kutzneria kofuensis TaxID=103725 RepID=UPI0031E7CB32